MSKFFYGRVKMRPVVKMDVTTNEVQLVFSTQTRPVGTKVEDPEEGVYGNNSAEHNPPTHVTLYHVPGGTGAADETDPVTDWGLIKTADAIADGILRPICTGYLTREWSVRKGDSEGGESVERRFAVEVTVRTDKAIIDQGLGILSAHSAAMTLAVLKSQPEFDEVPKQNPKPKHKKAAEQSGLFDDKQVSAAPPVVVSEDDPIIEYKHNPEVAPAAEDPESVPFVPFVLIPAKEGEPLAEQIARSIVADGRYRIHKDEIIGELNAVLSGDPSQALITDDSLFTLISENGHELGINPNGTVFAVKDLRSKSIEDLRADIASGLMTKEQHDRLTKEIADREFSDASSLLDNAAPEPESMIERATKARRKK